MPGHEHPAQRRLGHPPIVEGAEEAGAYLVTQWNKPADLNVTDYDQWLSHITYNGVESGKQIGDALAEAIGGEGGIIALQGILDTGAAKDRFAGLEESLAANPGIKLLDQQTANFSRAEALEVTKTLLTKHGDDVKGIWAANDDMALGALEALQGRPYGRRRGRHRRRPGRPHRDRGRQHDRDRLERRPVAGRHRPGHRLLRGHR